MTTPTAFTAAFTATLDGHAIEASDDDYEGARQVWNGMID